VRDRSKRDRLAQLTTALERADIHGRGGAGFPTATKLRAVAAQRGRPIVVVNAAEGEPLSQKDRYLLTSRADTVLDGARAAADALGADEIVVAVDQGLDVAAAALSQIAKARHDLNGKGMRTTVQSIPSGYVSGQETALIAVLAGGEAKPTFTPPYPFERGLRGRPTLVSNSETYSHIGRVARGSYDGSRLVTVTGAVSEPGLIEITSQTTMTGLLQSVGGFTESVRGVLLGGYSGTWARLADVAPLGLDEHRLRERSLTLGAGIVFLLGDSSCPVAEVARVAKWMAAESSGQCGPCIHGLSAIATALQELTSRGDRFATYGQIRRWSELVQKRGACAHPDGVARFVTTALDVFSTDFDDHAHHGACERCAVSSALPTPRRRPDRPLISASRQLTREADVRGQGVLR
jgi:NADH:ubiquinone oxidoreductase subunit F (NADH-binding)